MSEIRNGATGQPATGWNDRSRADPAVVRLRAHLEANNGIADLRICRRDQIDEAIAAFHRDGFAVIADVLSPAQIDLLASGCDEVINEVVALDAQGTGNRGSHRYSFGGSSFTRSQLHRPAWQMLLEQTLVQDVVAAIFGSQDFMLRAASGDFCLPGAVDYQRLHSDVRDWVSSTETPFSAYFDRRGEVTLRDLPCPYLCVNFLPQDGTRLNGPTRQIPGTQNSRANIPGLPDEPEWMRLSTVCPVPAGSIMLRDTRAWHGGTPNVSDATRSIPNLEFYAPWFREPLVPGISYADFRRLSERAQRLVRFCVADSSEKLITGTTLRAS